MKNQKILAMFFIFCFVMMSIASVSAFMPKNTHKLIHTSSVADPVDSELWRACNKYPSLCYTGNVLTDISVIWYWTEGYKYAVTHSPNFCRALIEEANNDQEYACAVGGCLHQPADIVSHNDMVPYAIKHSLLANVVIHVFAEQQVDTWVTKNYPGIGDEALNYLSDYETCTPLFKRVMLGQQEFSDITEEEVNDKFDKFIVEIMTSQTGYDTAFKQKSVAVNFKSIPFTVLGIYILLMSYLIFITLLVFVKIFKKQAMLRHYVSLIIFLPLSLAFGYVFISNLQGSAFNSIVTIATIVTSPILYYILTGITFILFIFAVANTIKSDKKTFGAVISLLLFFGSLLFLYLSVISGDGIVPLGNTPEFYVNQAITFSKELLTQGTVWLTDKEASGFTALDEADRQILLYDYILLFALVVFFSWYTWFLLRKNKIKPTKTFSGSL